MWSLGTWWRGYIVISFDLITATSKGVWCPGFGWGNRGAGRWHNFPQTMRTVTGDAGCRPRLCVLLCHRAWWRIGSTEGLKIRLTQTLLFLLAEGRLWIWVREAVIKKTKTYSSVCVCLYFYVLKSSKIQNYQWWNFIKSSGTRLTFWGGVVDLQQLLCSCLASARGSRRTGAERKLGSLPLILEVRVFWLLHLCLKNPS